MSDFEPEGYRPPGGPPYYPKGGNGWGEYQRLVLAELKRFNDNFETINLTIAKMQVEIGKLQIKAGVWGAIGGAIPVLVLLVVSLLKVH
jgi:hypothetical protein